MRPVRLLQPGQRFRLPSTGRTGTLLYANESRARVRLDGNPVEFDTGEGRHVAFYRGREIDWSPDVEVEVVKS